MGDFDGLLAIALPLVLLAELLKWIFSSKKEKTVEEDVEPAIVLERVVYLRPESHKQFARRVYNNTVQDTTKEQEAVNLW